MHELLPRPAQARVIFPVHVVVETFVQQEPLFNSSAPAQEQCGGSQIGAVPDVHVQTVGQGLHGALDLSIRSDEIPCSIHNVRIWAGIRKGLDRRQSPRQQPVVRIQPHNPFPARLAEAAVNAFRHAGILFHMQFQVRVGVQDIQGAVRGPGVLDNVFKCNPFLVFDALYAFPYVAGVIIAGRNNAEIRFCVHRQG